MSIFLYKKRKHINWKLFCIPGVLCSFSCLHRSGCFVFPQIPFFPFHGGALLPNFLTSNQRRVARGCGGTFSAEYSGTSFGSDQMGLSATVCLLPWHLVKVNHYHGTMDSSRPTGSVYSGYCPGGKSSKIIGIWVLDIKFSFSAWIGWCGKFQ